MQVGVCELVEEEVLIFIVGCYEGIDECFIEEYVDEEWLIGDYVLFGGELLVMVLVDVVMWLLFGVLGYVDFVEEDFFMDGLFDCLYYI